MAIKYNLYTTAAGGTKVASDINTGYQHDMSGVETITDFYVESYNAGGATSDSNVDDGWAKDNPLLSITWDTQSAGTSVSVTGTMEYSNDNGIIWTEISGSNRYLSSGVGPYELRETSLLGPVTNVSLYSTYKSQNFDGSMTVKGGSNLTSTGSMFSSLVNLVSLDITGLDTGNVTNMGGMFFNCSSLITLDTTQLDGRLVTNISSMFSRCRNLTIIDLSNFNANVDVSTSTFADCDELLHIDITGVDTTNVEQMMDMFSFCPKLTCITNINSIKAAAWFEDSDSGTYGMFYNTPALTQPDATAQADITDSNGANWVNANPCP